MAITTVEMFWLRMLIQELCIGLLMAPVLWCDNVSALVLAFNPLFYVCTKHIEVDYYFIRENVLNGDIVIKFIFTVDKLADIFTKGLPFACLRLLWSGLMVLLAPLT